MNLAYLTGVQVSFSMKRNFELSIVYCSYLWHYLVHRNWMLSIFYFSMNLKWELLHLIIHNFLSQCLTTLTVEEEHFHRQYAWWTPVSTPDLFKMYVNAAWKDVNMKLKAMFFHAHSFVFMFFLEYILAFLNVFSF